MLLNYEKLAFMKEAMSDMAEIFKNDPQKMMPACMKAMTSKGFEMGPDASDDENHEGATVRARKGKQNG